MHRLARRDVGKDFAILPYSGRGVVATAFYAQYIGMLHDRLIAPPPLHLTLKL
jgi:hypothetical protein